VKIFPTDYKRVLAELAAAEAAASNGGERAASNGAGPPHADEFEGDTVDVVGSPHMREGDGE